MRTILILVLTVFSAACVAQGQALPTSQIIPADIVQNSIRLFHPSTNRFAVRWTYTEAGAKKLLAFQEAHEGQKVRIEVGTFESYRWHGDPSSRGLEEMGSHCYWRVD